MSTQGAREALATSRKDALAIAGDVGIKHVRTVLEHAAADLEKRLTEAFAKTKGEDTFTTAQLRATLEQVRAVLAKIVMGGMRDAVLASGDKAAEASAANAMQYMGDAHYAFDGMKAQPLAIDEAFMFDKAKSGARASILQRLARSGEPEGVDREEHKAKPGILARYGLNVIDHFEQVMQQGVLTRAPMELMRKRLIEQSPFLQAAPLYWAERIVRTETMNAYNRAGWEAMRVMDDELGDMCKILSATFDNRTAADSYAVHGQIRRMTEAFDTWHGSMMHPPARPNDREVVVPHRISWPIPPYLRWKTDAEVRERWHYEGRKGSPPPRPKLTTIDLDLFGKPQPFKGDDEEQEPQGPLEQPRPLGFEELAEEQETKAAALDVLPERTTLTPEEKAKQKLAAMSTSTGTVYHDLFQYKENDPPYYEGLTDAEKKVLEDILDGKYPSLFSEEMVEIDTAHSASDVTNKGMVTKAIDNGGTKPGELPDVVIKDGASFISIGTDSFVASSLLGKTHIKVNAVNLDNPGVKGFIKAVAAEADAAKKKAEEEAKEAKAKAEAEAKKAAKVAKMKATKAANKAKKLAAEQAVAQAKAEDLPDVDVSAKAIDPANILHRKYADQKGSNVGGFYEGKDGIKRYVKEYSDPAQAHGEAVSNAIYRALGFDAPESEVFEHNGKLHHAAKLFDGKTLNEAGLTEDRAKKVLDGFAADVLLANWDVVGMSQDNVFVQPDGKLARIDNGGSLLMRAKAGRKDKVLLGQLTEWDNFFNSKNPAYRTVAAKAGVHEVDDMREQAAAGIKKILALHDKHGGSWDSFVSKVAPGFKGDDRQAIVDMLEKRTGLLRDKLPELTKPKPKPEVQEAAPGKMAPPKTTLKALAKAPAPKSKPNETPDGRPLSEYRDFIASEIDKVPSRSRSAVTKFTGGSYRSMREAYSNDDRTSETGEAAHRIIGAFEKAKPVPGTVYRGIGVSSEIAQAYCELDEDEPLHLGPWGGKPAFASASRKMDVARSFASGGEQPIMFVMEHKRGIGIETVSLRSSEYEVLMHPDAHFRVTQRYRSDMSGRDFLVLHLEELEEHEIEAHYTKKGLPLPKALAEKKQALAEKAEKKTKKTP